MHSYRELSLLARLESFPELVGELHSLGSRGYKENQSDRSHGSQCWGENIQTLKHVARMIEQHMCEL